MTAYIHRTAHDMREFGLLSARDRANEAKHLAKEVSVSDTPRNYCLVTRASSDGFFMQLMGTRLRGMASVFGLLLICISILGCWAAVFITEKAAASFLSGSAGFVFDLALWGASVALLVAPLVAGVRAFRIDIFGPKDIPLVFNRKTRKVYKFVQTVPTLSSAPGNFVSRVVKFAVDVFRPWPMTLIEYDWDCLEAEYFERTTLMGNVVKTFHVLQFYVKETPTSDKVIGSFTIASPMMIGRDIAMGLWEFIRRYMEENGPVMCPGDKPAPPHPKNLFQAAQTVAPKWWVLLLAGTVWSTWKYMQPGGLHLLGVEAIVLFTVALFCDFMMLTIIFNWLAHKWGQDVTLPPEMMADAGAPLDLNKLVAEARATAA